MTKTLKWLGGGLAAAMLLAAVGLFSGNAAEAQDQPPTAPSLFGGTVTIDGEGAAAGTVVTAVVDGDNCVAGTVTTGEGGSRYALQVPSDCNSDVSTVSFTVGNVDTGQTAERGSPTPTTVDLTVTSAVEEDAPTPPADDEEEADMPAPPADDEEEADMPAPPADDEEEADMPAPPADDEEEADMPAPPADDEDADGMGDEEDADGMGDEEDADGMGDEEDADGMGDEEDADGMGDEEDADGMGDEEDADGMGDEEMAPDVMDTGTGLAPNTSASLAAILGLTALAVVLGGYTFARRRR